MSLSLEPIKYNEVQQGLRKKKLESRNLPNTGNMGLCKLLLETIFINQGLVYFYALNQLDIVEALIASNDAEEFLRLFEVLMQLDTSLTYSDSHEEFAAIWRSHDTYEEKFSALIDHFAGKSTGDFESNKRALLARFGVEALEE